MVVREDPPNRGFHFFWVSNPKDNENGHSESYSPFVNPSSTQVRAQQVTCVTFSQHRLPYSKEPTTRVLGHEKFFELDAGESFSDVTQDGVYVVAVETKTIAQAI
jgi:hypothetical protein